ncbi:MHC class II transactivator isoform X3 [Oryzias melastigma]|uniref:MHC class II transactivator isoform X3 n=1 Tax=Oryzias melastigma TaxID=30732 RepID=UPI00168D3F38|nr:MHC class II transactivator isoform X3 [Oryzias melastigma]
MGIRHKKKLKRKAERTGASCCATEAKMQEGDQDTFIHSDILPDDLSEFLDDNFLVSLLDPNALDNVFSSINMDDISPQTETPSSLDLIEPKKPPGNSKKRKRQRREERTCTNKKHTTKKARATGQPQPKEPHTETPFLLSSDAESGQNPGSGRTDLLDTPPKILRFYPPPAAAPIPIQFIAIPENSGYQLVQLPPPNSSVIRLPLPNTPTTPTYILVHADSPPCNRQIPPLSPVGGAVAPILMSSSPPGSLSDTASKAVSSSCVSLRSPSCDQPPVKEPPQSPSILDICQRVKDYIQAAKSHMYQLCLEMEEGLSIMSHYVDPHVTQREIYRLGKSTNKCSDKEFSITGRTHRLKNSLQLNQIFESSNEGKSRRCILLLGNAGMGKTTLIKKLCLDWSRDSFPQFDFVFLLDGKGLTLTEPVHSLQTLLLDLSSIAPCCVDPDEVYAQVLAAPKRVLLIFDGFDELRDYESLLQTQEKDCVTLLQKDSKMQTFTVRQLYSAILQRLLLPGCTLLLSSRPRGAGSQLLRRVDALLEVCGFTSDSIETYLTHYFTDPDLRASAFECLKSSSYLHHLCWNPALCRLACMVLEQGRSSEDLPRTLTELCHQVVCLKMEKHARGSTVCGSAQTQTSADSTQDSPTELSKNSQERMLRRKSPIKTRGRVNKSKKAKELGKQEDDKNRHNLSKNGDESDSKDLLLQLCALAWEGVKANSSSIPRDRTIPTKVKVFGMGMGILHPQNLRRRLSNEDNRNLEKKRVEGQSEKKGKDINSADCKDLILVWTCAFLQSYLAAVHLSFSRNVLDRSFLQALPFQTGAKCRRRPKKEELELTQRIVVGLLYHKKEKLQHLHSQTETVFRNTLTSRQGLAAKHLAGLSYSNLVPAQVLELCNYVYEASVSQESSKKGAGGTKLATQLAENLPESLRFNGVPFSPPDVFAMKDALRRGGAEGRNFCLDLENTGIQISGLRALMSLNNINSFRACIADVISLWEQLEQSGEEELLQGAVSKFHIHPLKATQVCHIAHLEKLVNIHMNKRLSESSQLSHSILADGVPAVKDLHKLEFELGSEEGPLALPKLWDLLPGLHNLQHLDLEESKIEDEGADKLAMVLDSLTSLEVLNLSQNCIGDHGVKKLALALKDLPKLHCLSLYSNEISDEGAESLAAVLPQMPSLTQLDVGYNKLQGVGAQSLALSLRDCKKVKTLRMWNQCIPYGVFERLQRQDSRIL